MNEQQLVSWVFGHQRGQSGVGQLENALQVQLDLVALIGTLSDAQRTKLELAGRGDIHRFLDQFEALRRDCPSGRITQEKWQEIWQKTQPLQARFRAGLHGRGSLFQRTIPSALTTEQFAKFRELEDERNRRHYQARVRGTVALIEQKVPLTADQRTRLIDLVIEKTDPPEVSLQGQQQYHLVLFQMSQIPHEELKPIFLDNEWMVLQRMLQQGRMVEHQLRQMQDAGLEP